MVLLQPCALINKDAVVVVYALRTSSGNSFDPFQCLDGSPSNLYHKYMIPQHFRSLFWDTNLENFDPTAYPVYTIERVLEHGDEEAVRWLLQIFTKEKIQEVLRTNQ